MILFRFLLIILVLFIYIVKVLEFLYRYQIKEYRWDRMKSYIKEERIFSVLYRIRMELPAKKTRNFAIFIVTFVSAIIYSWFIYRLPLSLLQLHVILAPIAAFIDVSLLVFFSNIPVKLYREWIISKAYKKIAASKTKVIMITGSYGKTSVKEYLYHVLKEKFNVAKTDANMNTDIGVALCILKNLKQNTDYFIAEVGAYRIGEIAKICSFVKPDYVIVTAFGNQHLDLYGSHANLVKAESEPLEFLDKDGIVFINADMPEFEKITAKREFGLKTFSISKKSAFVSASNIDTSEEGTAAQIHVDGHGMELKTKLLGKHTIQNLLPIVGISHTLGMSLTQIIKAIKTINPVKGKLSLHKGPNGSTIVNDAGNSNVHGFLQAISILSLFHHSNKIIVSKGIIELGKDKEESYKKILEKLAKTDSDLYTTDPLFAQLGGRNVLIFNSDDELLDSLEHQLNKSTIVVVEGKFSSVFLSKLSL